QPCQNLSDIVKCFRYRWYSFRRVRHGRPGIVGAQGASQIAAVAGEQCLQKAGSAIDIRNGLKRLLDTELGSRFGHELHQAHGSFRRNGTGAESRLLSHYGTKEVRLKTSEARGLGGERVNFARGKGIAIGGRVRPTAAGDGQRGQDEEALLRQS